MRISIVIPLYNKVKYITRALSSVAGQTFRDFEAIVVDDGSTDGSGELAAGFPDRRFRVIRQENAGPGAARNRGLAEATGDLVAFLDSDDAWLPDYLERSVALLDSEEEVDAVTAGHIEIPGYVANIAMWRRRGIAEGVHRITPDTEGRALQHMVAYMTPCTTVARLAIIRQWGGFAEGRGCVYGEDAALWLKILLNRKVWFQLQPLVIVDRAASQLCGNFKGPRPVESFLADSTELENCCPPELLPVLHRFMSFRSCKTAAAVGYSGDWRGARALVRDRVRLLDVGPMYFLAALGAGTPAGSAIGKLLLPGLGAGQNRRRSFWDRLA
ncbi:MAG TPA: glycosyltransferase family A protein [Bryobacteraceae bacterium]|nr:glycosyltransferase family A protein [Bryobacteraceae bacterium]